MECRSHALVLGSFPYGEQGRILRVLTRDFGRRSFLLHSLKSKRGGFSAAMARPFSAVELLWTEKQPEGLHRIREATWIHAPEALWNHPAKGLMTLFAAEVVEKSYRLEHPDEEKFDFLISLIQRWENQDPAGLLPTFLLEWCQLLGWGLELQSGRYLDLLEGRFTEILPLHSHYADGPAVDNLRAALTGGTQSQDGSIRFKTIEILADFLQLHLESRHGLNSLEVLRALY
jgi:DNA repair protein RecO (recombination protein O)